MTVYISKILGALMTVFMFAGQLVNADEAQSRPITGEALHKLLLDKTVISEYRDTTGGIKTYQFSEHHNGDGSTDYIELGQAPVKGLWELVGDDKVCYRYPKTPRFTDTYCFIVYKIDSCYYSYNTRSMTVNGPRNWDFWTSRFVVKGDGGSCADAVS